MLILETEDLIRERGLLLLVQKLDAEIKKHEDDFYDHQDFVIQAMKFLMETHNNDIVEILKGLKLETPERVTTFVRESFNIDEEALDKYLETL